STSTLYTDAVPARCSTSRAVEALPCGSRSTTRTRAPCRARLAARLTALVVLPTPPFWLAIVIIRHERGRGHSRPPDPREARAASAGVIDGRPGPGAAAAAPICPAAASAVPRPAGAPAPWPLVTSAAACPACAGAAC